ncbi:unnamed protein product [Vitrella brassicaformis CCMP3155]|uniref:NYN domain-containing protein n=1 Tax=Vitrella brassicaformis (strain CCMP3155) TaxID=1169540 RepID=A0A0G4ELF4_VITBC|nr:unnamed protein product [Vitrella brassicaformis CCMP3155]|eukprot:CEL98006.1 unnamed protein product [Vitrella brassicaformis CCMP3155]
MAAQRALKNFHKGIEHMAKIHEARYGRCDTHIMAREQTHLPPLVCRVKSNGKQKGADIAIADMLKDMADDPEIAAVVFVAGDGDFVETLEKTQGQKPVFLVTSDGSYDCKCDKLIPHELQQIVYLSCRYLLQQIMVPLVKKLHDLDAIFQPDF